MSIESCTEHPSFGYRPGARRFCRAARHLAWPAAAAASILWLLSLAYAVSDSSGMLRHGASRMAEAASPASGTPGVVPAALRLSAPAGRLPWWEEPVPAWLRSSTIVGVYRRDSSSVTAFLVMAFLGLLALGLHRVARDDRHHALLPDFPFPDGFRVLAVQLGLLGTLWGFLLLGFGLERTGGNLDFTLTVPLLVAAFGTALLSTITAIFLVYVARPAVRFACRRWVLLPGSDGSTGSGADEFVTYLRRSADELGGLARSVGSARAGLGASLDLASERLRSLVEHVERPGGHLEALAGEARQAGARLDRGFAAIEGRLGAIEATGVTLARVVSGELAAIREALADPAPRAERAQVLEELRGVGRSLGESLDRQSRTLLLLAEALLHLRERQARADRAQRGLSASLRRAHEQLGASQEARAELERRLDQLEREVRSAAPPQAPPPSGLLAWLRRLAGRDGGGRPDGGRR